MAGDHAQRISIDGPDINAEEASAPVDLAHLARFTLGDTALEREVLELFCKQSLLYLEQLHAATSHKEWCDAAHSLKGSARAVGAWRMARAAECVEGLREDVPPEMRAAQIGELEAYLQEASAFVASLGEDRGT